MNPRDTATRCHCPPDSSVPPLNWRVSGVEYPCGSAAATASEPKRSAARRTSVIHDAV